MLTDTKSIVYHASVFLFTSVPSDFFGELGMSFNEQVHGLDYIRIGVF